MGNAVSGGQSYAAYDYKLFNVVLDNASVIDNSRNRNLHKLDQQCDHNSIRADSGAKE